MKNKTFIQLSAATALLFIGATAHSAVITFDPLAGPNGTAYSGHSEAGFNISATDSWQEAFFVGNSVPSIFNFAGEGDSVSVVSDSAGTFTFGGMDLGTGGSGTYDWDVTGFLGGSTIFNQMGTFSGSSFTSVLSTSTGLIDELLISFSNFSISSINLDNIVVTKAASVPEPGTLALLGMGLLGLGMKRRRSAH